MLATSHFGSQTDDRILIGARWVLAVLHRAARLRGLQISNCRWQADDDADGDDRYVLTFDAAGTESWEPFEAADLEDLSISVRVRRSLEMQVRRLLRRVAEVAQPPKA